MPSSPKKPCTYPGCSSLVVRGYCERHHGSGYDARRGTSTQRGYGYTWRKIRDAFLRANPWCSDAYGLHKGETIRATQADHKIPKSQGGTDAWSNLDPKCDRCHSHKTAKEDGGFGNQSKGRGGKKVSASSNVNRAQGQHEKNSQCENFGNYGWPEVWVCLPRNQ